MNREKAESFVEAALAKLDRCKTDEEVVTWDCENSATHEYLELSIDLVLRLENAYRDKVLSIWGS